MQGTLTDVDLTDGAVSNGETELKDGLKGPNESPDEDGESVLNGGTGPKKGLKGSTNEFRC